MQTFIAVAGIHPELSLAEVQAQTNTATMLTSDLIQFETNESLETLQKRLGGVQKLAKVIARIPGEQAAKRIAEDLSSMKKEGKLRFGLSGYGVSSKQVHRIGMTVKKAMKEQGQSIRLVTGKEDRLSTVIVAKNKLTTQGREYLLIQQGSEVLIAITKTIQDFEDWSRRDFDRPARDARRGMLPPKLARMMVNLAGVSSEDSVLLDPFCGSGTVLMEAGLVGYTKLIGSDLEQPAIDNTQQNATWLATEYSLPVPELHSVGAQELTDVLEPTSVDVIVTEPFLGTPRKANDSESFVEKEIAKLTDLYEACFESISACMKGDGVLVIASPIHHFEGKAYPVPTREILQQLGWTQQNDQTIYQREGQFVARDIIVARRSSEEK